MCVFVCVIGAGGATFSFRRHFIEANTLRVDHSIKNKLIYIYIYIQIICIYIYIYIYIYIRRICFENYISNIYIYIYIYSHINKTNSNYMENIIFIKLCALVHRLFNSPKTSVRVCFEG